MRISYFGYYLRHQKDGKCYFVDLRAFLKSFCRSAPIPVKNKILQGEEHLYLFHQAGNLFLFVQTRSNEIIKKVNKRRISLEELHEVMAEEDALGFVSYAYFWGNYFGFASTLLAPRVTALGHLINRTMSSSGLGKYEFVVEAFVHQASKAEALKLPFLGKTVIEVSKYNGAFQRAIDMISVGGADFQNIATFELVIKPKRGKNIEQAVKKAIHAIDDDGLTKFTVKAKDEIDGHLTELYLAGMGSVTDSIDKKDIGAINEAFKSRISDNSLLQKKIQEFHETRKYDKLPDADMPDLGNPRSWAGRLYDI